MGSVEIYNRITNREVIITSANRNTSGRVARMFLGNPDRRFSELQDAREKTDEAKKTIIDWKKYHEWRRK